MPVPIPADGYHDIGRTDQPSEGTTKLNISKYILGPAVTHPCTTTDNTLACPHPPPCSLLDDSRPSLPSSAATSSTTHAFQDAITGNQRDRSRSNNILELGVLPRTPTSAMHSAGYIPFNARTGASPLVETQSLPGTVSLPPPPQNHTPIEWDWDVEHMDRKRESKADSVLHGAQSFHVDRRVLKDVIRQNTHAEVGRITFLSSGTFHKAYLITLVDTRTIVARVARRFMPRLKTESEVATIQYLRDKTSIPVPDIYHYDSNPYNRLGGEYILMSKAPGIPLSQAYYSMSNDELKTLFTNLASIILPLFAQRFSHIGSLYFGPQPAPLLSTTCLVPTSVSTALSSASSTPVLSSTIATPTPGRPTVRGFKFMPLLSGTPTLSYDTTPDPMSSITHSGARDSSSPSSRALLPQSCLPTSPSDPSSSADSSPSSSRGYNYHIGPIISWPFFGSNRGFLNHPTEINRGPWATTSSYLSSCMSREITSVIHESEGRSASHRLHLDPDEIQSSRHHHLEAIPDDADSDESDEWDAQESEEEWEECAGDLMYRDYRRMQRGTFLVAHIRRREEAVRRELGRWFRLMERLGACKAEKCISSGSISQSGTENGEEDVREEFGLDCHDLSLENVFVDEKDHTRITCVIDWESTTTRPLWACAHLPAFVQSSPFTARLFRETVAHIATGHSLSPSTDSLHSQSASNSHLLDLSAVASEWLHYESWGARLRHAHRCAEWDGWEEGLVDSILGPEDTEEEWFKEGCACEDVDKPGGVDDECVCDEQGGKNGKGGLSPTNGETMEHARWQSPLPAVVSSAVVSHTAGLPAPSVAATLSNHTIAPMVSRPSTPSAALRVQRRQVGKLILKKEREREQTLVSAGDICGGRGGELGRRLEELVRRGLGAR